MAGERRTTQDHIAANRSGPDGGTEGQHMHQEGAAVQQPSRGITPAPHAWSYAHNSTQQIETEQEYPHEGIAVRHTRTGSFIHAAQTSQQAW
jgi:hypothetical protein